MAKGRAKTIKPRVVYSGAIVYGEQAIREWVSVNVVAKTCRVESAVGDKGPVKLLYGTRGVAAKCPKTGGVVIVPVAFAKFGLVASIAVENGVAVMCVSNTVHR